MAKALWRAGGGNDCFPAHHGLSGWSHGVLNPHSYPQLCPPIVDEGLLTSVD